ncbi:MAG TPA: ABC transporter substrate-binding protein [Actinomycetota bacterium]|nr:ABC transporter substrate-binding protein [Actinomycetota bacterium]
MPRFLLALLIGLLALAGAACGSDDEEEPAAKSTPAAADACAPDQLALLEPGTLTVGTDKPAYPPYFEDDDPTNGEGFESAVAYAIADQLGFSDDQVEWVVVPFNNSYAPGPKDFDFDINQISVTPEREGSVTFSDGYYDVSQALVVNKETPIADATSIADLKPFQLGVQIGTTSLDMITEVIQPDAQPRVFDRSVDVIQALNNGQIDGYVVDAPTAYVNVLIGQAENGVVVGQFPEQGEHFGLVFEQDNPLVECVNLAIAALEADGSLQALQDEWLADLTYPVLQ